MGRLTKIAGPCVTAAAASPAARIASEGGGRRSASLRRGTWHSVVSSAVARHAAIYFEALLLRAGVLRSDFFFRPSEATSSESAPNWAMT